MEEDGGDLKLHLPQTTSSATTSAGNSKTKKIIRVAPIAGRVAIFRADLTEHEVCPVLNSKKNRYSILVWYFQREERMKKLFGDNDGGSGAEMNPRNTDYLTKSSGVSESVEREARELVQKVYNYNGSSGGTAAAALNQLAFKKYSPKVRKLAGEILMLKSAYATGGEISGANVWITEEEILNARAGIATMGRKS